MIRQIRIRHFLLALALFGLGGNALQADCGCVTNYWTATCCNPGEVSSGTCTLWWFDEINGIMRSSAGWDKDLVMLYAC